jgi:drug/metabolite transporter (DMT)-like permease
MTSLAPTLTSRLSSRAIGVAFAFAAAIISGIAVFVNSKGVSHFDDATVYTTAKNAVAGGLLLALALPLLGGAARSGTRAWRPQSRRATLGLIALACVGGSVPFVLFFEGLSRATATQAAFIQKTLVIWVALLAVPLLRERVRPVHLAAIALVVAGQAWLAGGIGTIGFGGGETMILAATLMWAVEVILVKRLVVGIDPRILAAGRMALGVVILSAWVLVSGRASGLFGLSAEQWQWALVTGLLLTGYVGTWYAALAFARAIDVTAVLVFGAVITAALSGTIDGAAVDVAGVALVTAGVALAVFAALTRQPRPVARS